MDVEKTYTNELKKVLTYISKELINEYPLKKISTEHFILSILNNRQCLAYNLITRTMKSDNMVDLYNYYAQNLHEKKIAITKISKESNIGYDSILSTHMVNADSERDKLSDPKISSEHVLLSILNENKVIYENLALYDITYSNVINEINYIRSEDIKKQNNRRDTLKTITGVDTSKSKKGSFLSNYCLNLNNEAKSGKITPIIGREKEVSRIIEVIGRKDRNNVILVGDSGVGKTAIINGIAHIIEDGTNERLLGKTIYSLNTVSIFTGVSHRGILEERIEGVVNEIKKDHDSILFIDDIHNMVYLGGQDVLGILMNALSDGDVKLIATTNFKDFKSSIEVNSSIHRRLQKITVEPNNISEAENILENSKELYERHHNVRYSNDVIKTCVYLANKHITGRKLPDSAIDIMDECGSRFKGKNNNLHRMVELKKELKKFEAMRDKSMRINDFILGDEYNRKVKETRSMIIDEEKSNKSTPIANIISQDNVYEVVSSMTGVPVSRLSVNEKEKYLSIEKSLSKQIIGQDEAVLEVAKAVRRNRVGVRKKEKPTSMLFIGESGVGKTLLGKKLAEEIYGSENSLVRIDMSEYADKTSVNKIIGSSAGYIGYEHGGVLTEAIKKNPYCVLLLDEIEKADKNVYNIFLQVFDNGFITDNTGIKVSFRDVIIIMTSNVGVKEASSLGRSSGFESNTEKNKKDIIQKSVKKHFPIEFINRIDNIVYFNSLSDDDLKKIIDIELNTLKKRLNDIGYDLWFDTNVINSIFKGLDADQNPGARKVIRAIQDKIEDKISDLYIENDYENGHTFKIDVENDEINIK